MIELTRKAMPGEDSLTLPEARFRLLKRSPSGNSLDVTKAGIEDLPASDAALGGLLPRSEHMLADMVERSRKDAARSPGSARALAHLGMALMNEGRLEEAAGNLREALSIDANEAMATRGLARIHLFRGELEMAEALFLELRAAHPHDPEPFVGLSEIQRKRSHLIEARELAVQAVALSPDYVRARIQAGLVAIALGRHREAIADLRHGLGLQPRSAALQHAIGVAYALSGDKRRAARAFRLALSIDPGTYPAAKALAAVVRDSSPEEAIELLIRYLGAEAEDDDARELLAWLFLKTENVARAQAELLRLERSARTAIVDTSRLSRVLNNLGVCSWRSARYEEAVTLFQRALHEDSGNDLVPRKNLMGLLLTLGQPESAMSLFDGAREETKDDESVRILLGLCLDEAGDRSSAVKWLSTVVHSGSASPDAYAALGGLLADSHEPSPYAATVLEDGLVKYPDHEALLNNLALAYIRMRSFEAASRLLDKAMHQRPPVSPVLFATLGLLKIEQGQVSEGALLYDQAARRAKETNSTLLSIAIEQKKHLELGRALAAGGHVGEALSEVMSGLRHTGRLRYSMELSQLRSDLLQVTSGATERE